MDRGKRAGASVGIDETVESIEQGVYDRLAEGVCRIGNPAFVACPGGCGEARTLLHNDAIGAVHGPLRKVLAAVDDQRLCIHARALRALRFVCHVLASLEMRDLYCVRAYCSPRHFCLDSVDQAAAFGAVDEVLYGRERPFGSAPWRTLMQPLELVRDFAQCELRIG